jgi:thioredoxin 1
MKVAAGRAAALAGVLVVAMLAVGCRESLQFPAIASSDSLATAAPDHFAAGVGQGRPTVIEFGASACASCKEMKIVLDELRRTHGTQIGIAEIDLIRERDAIRRYRIQVMPTQVFFDEQGRETGRHVGVIDGPTILSRLGVPRQAR